MEANKDRIPPTNKASLVTYLALRRIVPEGEVRWEVAALDPLFRKADAGVYDLEPAERLDSAVAARAIADGTGATVSGVSFLSLSEHGRPREGHALQAFWDDQARGRCDIAKALNRRFEDDLALRMGRNVVGVLSSCVWRTLGEKLWWSFQENRWDELAGQAFLAVVRANLMAIVRQYCAAVALGDHALAGSLLPLVAFTARGLPIGERKNERGHWDCVTA